MLVSDVVVNRLRGAAEALDVSPVDYVFADVPAYNAENILHPLVDEEQEIGAPFTFHPFKLSAAVFDEHTLCFKLVPPTDMKVSTPIVKHESIESYKRLPKIGYSALRGMVIHANGDGNQFTLLGEPGDEGGETASALTMPTEKSANTLAFRLAGIVQSKAITSAIQQQKSTT